jgi:hypothetical protein
MNPLARSPRIELRAATGSERAALCEQVLEAPPSAWRDETLRRLFELSLGHGDLALGERLGRALEPGIALEERLVFRAGVEPLAALADDGVPFLSAAAQRRFVAACLSRFPGASSGEANALARALRDALDWWPAPSAFLHALRLVQAYCALPAVGAEHLLALAGVGTPSSLAQADLLRAVGAALAARGAMASASELNARADRITREAQSREVEQLKSGMRSVSLAAGVVAGAGS